MEERVCFMKDENEQPLADFQDEGRLDFILESSTAIATSLARNEVYHNPAFDPDRLALQSVKVAIGLWFNSHQAIEALDIIEAEQADDDG